MLFHLLFLLHFYFSMFFYFYMVLGISVVLFRHSCCHAIHQPVLLSLLNFPGTPCCIIFPMRAIVNHNLLLCSRAEKWLTVEVPGVGH